MLAHNDDWLVERHVSPDGALVFRIERVSEGAEQGTVAFGFEGQEPHYHPDMFQGHERGDIGVARAVASALINDRMVIVTTYRSGEAVCEILEDMSIERELWAPDDPMDFRFWTGRRIARAELLEGSVDYVPVSTQIFA